MVSIYSFSQFFFIKVWCNFVLLVLDLKIYTLEKDNFADFAHFKHSVLEMGQVLVLELISPAFTVYRRFYRLYVDFMMLYMMLLF